MSSKAAASGRCGRVGVRELRQNLSVFLERVKAGERLEVTEHGRPVALLVPLPPATDALARWIAEGRVRAATADLAETLERYPPLPCAPGERTLSEILREMRDDERF